MPKIGHVTSRGQVVIPIQLRRRFGIRTGTPVSFTEGQGEIVLRPLTRAYVQSLRGILKSNEPVLPALLEERRRDREKEDRPLGRRRAR